MTATSHLKQLAAGEITAVALTSRYLKRIEQIDAKVGAFLRVNAESALVQAEAVDRKRSEGKKLGPLAGIPVAVKDLLCTVGEPTTCASKILENYIPPYDATAVAKLKAADAVLIGKTNLDEFAMGGSTENSALGDTRNPWDLERIPGGSSGGSAACVAATLAPLAVGTDTGGSIRQPAALCGVVGMKPTYGRVSRYGLIAFASSLDQIGPMAQTVEDAALLLQVLAGHDPLDSTSAPQPVPNWCDNLHQPLAGLKLGRIIEHAGDGVDEEIVAAVEEAIAVYKSLGASVVDVSLPHSKYGIATYYILAPCEASSNLARFDAAHYGYRTSEKEMLAALAEERKAAADPDDIDSPLVRMYRQSRSEGFGPEVQRRIMLGTYALSAGYIGRYYLKAQKVRRLIRQDYDAAFAQCDLLIGPTTPHPAFKVGEKSGDPLAMYLEDLFTVGTNLAGLPGISLPCGFTNSGLPIGLQLQAPPLEEDRLLRAAQMFEQATDWHQRRPEL